VVGCLSENTIQELVAGSLSSDVRAQAQQHIETCAQCRMLVIELARDSDLEAVGTTVVSEPAARATSSLAPRALVKRFELVRPLGRGGMGVVYEAIDRERGARVALKTLQSVSADGLLRFKTEFRALQDVQHPSLVTFGELFEDRGQWWLTMELVEGTPLLDHVRPGGRLDERRLRAALPQLAAALQALHAHGLVHRDVKPHNVLVTSAGRLVLLDFGLVASVAQSESNVVGTPAYMAPEQALLQEIGPAADWYGVGALLYEALTGALPFQGAPLQVLIAKQHELPRRPGELASVPQDLDAICMLLLAVEPAARLSAIAALAGLDPDAAVASPSTAPAASPVFVGRERELAGLADAFAETRAGGEAGGEAIVLVEGESGIGKSALVGQFLRDLSARAPAVLVLHGRCYERETVPYKGIDGVVDALARYLRKLSPADTAAILPRRARVLVQAFPVLGKVSALSSLPADDVLDLAELRLRAFAALRDLLGRLAERTPLVVWIDDLHWADADSLELLTWVMARPEAPPLLLLLTCRPPREAADGSGADATMARVRALPGLRRLELPPLPRDEAVALAERLLAEVPVAAGASAAAVADEAAGHPLFIDALVRHTAGTSTAPPPLRLSDALWARITGLDPSARQLLALLAVAGWPLSHELLIAASVLPADELDLALGRLRRAHLARATDGTGTGTVEPYHDRIREAVLDHLDPELRKQCHRALARALLAIPPPSSPSSGAWGPEAVGVHLQAAGDLEQAAQHLVLAADQAAAALAFDRAARLYRQALALHDESGAAAGPLGDPRDVLTRLAQALVNASRGAEAGAVYLELARRASAAGGQDLELRLRAAEQLLRGGHQDDGQRVLVGVLEELDLRPPATRAGALWRLLWRRARVRVSRLGSLSRGHRAESGEAPPRVRLRLEACRVAALFADLAVEYTTRYQVMALQTTDLRCIGEALLIEANLALMLSGATTRRTAKMAELLAAVTERSGDPYLLAQEQRFRGLMAFELGQWARSREHSVRAVQLFRERCLGAAVEAAAPAVVYIQCLFNMGALRDYVRALPPMLREAEDREDRFTLALLYVGWAGLMSLIQDQPAAALQQIERGMEWNTAAFDFQRLTGPASQAEVELYGGDSTAAYRRIDEAWRQRSASPLSRMVFVRARMLSTRGLAALAVCRSAGPDPDRRLVRAAARDARDLRALRLPWTRALARILDAGVALVTGARTEARAQLERARAELESAGMSLHATLAQRRLGELTGGAEGARAVAEADAWLAAQGVRAPARLARLFMPEVAPLRQLSS